MKYRHEVRTLDRRDVTVGDIVQYDDADGLTHGTVFAIDHTTGVALLGARRIARHLPDRVDVIGWNSRPLEAR